MADSQDESDSIVDPTDDGQLTIRIPNPKVYMARQSQWIGRRGKPRCDHCRLNNLKVPVSPLHISIFDSLVVRQSSTYMQPLLVGPR